MSDTRTPRRPDPAREPRPRGASATDPPPLALARFARVLEAYGASPERWPSAERAGAERLLVESAEARRLHAEAAELDALLDTAAPSVPSAGLAARVLGERPQQSAARRAARWGAVAIPLAAAAALALWVTNGRAPAPDVAEPALVAVGDWTEPTDALLGSFAVDASAPAPAVGCLDSVLGCPTMDDDGQKESRG